MAKSKDCTSSIPRILTHGRLLVLVLALLALTANLMADIVERYPAGSTTANYTGNDLTDVQTHSGYADGDVIKVSADIAVGSTISYDVNNFTLQAKTNPVTISNAVDGDNSLYELPSNESSLTFKNVTISGFANTCTSHLNYLGGAISLNGTTTINTENVTFTGNKSEGSFGSGGAIYSSNSLSISGTTTFTDNTANDGGAIYSWNPLTISGTTMFTDNTAYSGGGAIYSWNSPITISGTTTFTGNTANYGGAVSCIELIISDTTTFTGNRANQGGAVCCSDTTISGTTTFTDNTANDGGAILCYNVLSISGSTTFSGNTAGNYGGAIHNWEGGILFSGDNSVGTFTNNRAGYANDVFLIGWLTFQDKGTYSFDGGICLDLGSDCPTTINEAHVTIAGRKGDNTNIYEFLNVTISNGGTLTAKLDYIDSIIGTFDIRTDETSGTLELNVGNGVETTFDNTLAGNGTLVKSGTGKLTLTNGLGTDNNSFSGTTIINEGVLSLGADSTLCNLSGGTENIHGTLESAGNLTLNNTTDSIYIGSILATNKTITVDPGADKTMKIYTAANGKVQAESFVISSGEVDVKGCMEANVQVEANATFSPGNSVGHVDINGTFTLDSGATLLIEMDETGIDTMSATSFDLDNGTISFTLSDAIPFGSTYDILTATGGAAFDEDILTRILNGQTLPSYYTLALAGSNNNIVRFSIDRNAVPEPSTWALLILGVAGLMYVRKRKN